LAERLGFSLEGRLREHETTHKGLCDMLVYGLLRREWAAGTQDIVVRSAAA
jgi:RimJ/RimL family protein N-acetyltransferase